MSTTTTLPASITERRFLDTPQLSELLNVKQKALEHWRNRGKGPKYIKAGKFVRYDEADVLAWLEEQKRSNTTQKARPQVAAV